MPGTSSPDSAKPSSAHQTHTPSHRPLVPARRRSSAATPSATASAAAQKTTLAGSGFATQLAGNELASSPMNSPNPTAAAATTVIGTASSPKANAARPI